ncbi:MAG TPA: hypothetical protein VGG72_20880 [Bryobacteraceae bacterium]|jgi:hypothetical protein
MSPKVADPRIIAIALRASRIGYAVFAGPKELLDCGTHATTHDNDGRDSVEGKRIVALFPTFLPDVVVVKAVPKKQRTLLHRSRNLRGLIIRESALRGKPVVILKDKDVKEAFRIFQGPTKYDRARVIASAFPELHWRLPPRRKLWQSEPRAMLIFDAIAVGFAYWRHYGAQTPSSKKSSNKVFHTEP